MPISSAACLPDLPLEGAREADEPLPVPDKARSPLTLPDLPLDLALEDDDPLLDNARSPLTLPDLPDSETALSPACCLSNDSNFLACDLLSFFPLPYFSTILLSERFKSFSHHSTEGDPFQSGLQLLLCPHS